jgi:starch phosphorylase
MATTDKLYDQLMEIAYNLWWSWEPDVIEIFRDLDTHLFREVNHSAVAFLKKFGKKRLAARGKQLAIESRVIYAYHRMQEYMGAQRNWGTTHAGPLLVWPVGYFSAEFGLHESIPIYSGGLGVLAGDHLKSASDLGVPVVGVGLFYDQGYFRQMIDTEGWQQEFYSHVDRDMLPVRQAKDAQGNPVTIRLQTRSGALSASVLTIQVGRSRLVLLDPRMEDNLPDDQKLAGQLDRLYGGDQRVRIRQEMLLGVGGLRALRALGIEPAVLHLNEGHSAFVILEAARQIMQEQGMNFWDAIREVSARSVFTTHTPVDAGHDRFTPELIEETLGPLREELGIDQGALLSLGRVRPEDRGEPFCMTVLALKNCQRSNGVSFIHGGVSRRMWNTLWPGKKESDVPIGHITNGVHVASWLAPQMRRLYERHLGRSWIERIRRREVWNEINSIDDGELWETHRFLKDRLVEFVRRRLVLQGKARGEPEERLQRYGAFLNPDALTIGFARRFALYKRAWLLLSDEAWLQKFLCSKERPVQVIYAGKSHPRDDRGKELIQRIHRLSRDPRFEGHIVMVEDYDINVGRHLVQGVDLWLNNPRRPNQACGTSGQKVVLTGGLNCSTLDGWWAEAYDGNNGFAIGSGRVHMNPDEQDRREAEELRTTLEREVVPMFYRQDVTGLPRDWVSRMKHGLASLAWRYNADRMVVDYTEICYLRAGGATTSAVPEEDDLDLPSLFNWLAHRKL